MDEDPEESGVYAVKGGKACKSKSFPFMSEYSGLFYLKMTIAFSMIWENIGL
jgi:hypothetical protein